jgi:multicomponent Na+:H+ antiporter subunit G
MIDSLDWQLLLSWALILGGSFFVLVGGIGVLRMPDLYTRVHSASVTEILGPFMVLAGMIVQSGLSLTSGKLLAIMLFLMLTSPTGAYALTNAAQLSGLRARGARPMTKAELRESSQP